MEIALLIFNYGTMLMYFDWLYRLFTPRVKFLKAFLSFFIIFVLIQGSINIYIIPADAFLIRMLVPQALMFLWVCVCFEDSLDFKLYGCLMQILITFFIEILCMVIYFLLAKERLAELINDEPIMLFILRVFSLFCNLAAYEFFIYIIKKYGVKKVIYPTITIPILAVMFLTGNCIQYLNSFDTNNNLFLLKIFFHGSLILILLVWIFFAVYLEIKKAKNGKIKTEIEKKYQDLLNEYMNVSDIQMLEKYLKHDLLNHLQVLNDTNFEVERIHDE